jgi:hypothetical protein
VVILTPHGGDLQGFALLRGSEDQVAALRADEEFQRRVARADLIIESRGVVDAAIGEGLARARGTTTDIQTATTPTNRPARGTGAQSSGPNSARLLTGVETASQEAIRGLCDSLKRKRSRHPVAPGCRRCDSELHTTRRRCPTAAQPPEQKAGQTLQQRAPAPRVLVGDSLASGSGGQPEQRR